MSNTADFTASSTLTQRPEISGADQALLERVLRNWKLTPATMGYKLSGGAYIPAPWLLYASQRIAYGIAKGGARIILSAPPRHGKTKLVSVYTSTWVLENFPKRNVMLASYGADLSEQAGREVRDLIWDKEDLLNVRVPRETSRVERFFTNQQGYMFSVGLGGAITGRGAHVLLIDDYIKEIKEALSPAYRDYAWNWFVTTAMTRLEPNASVIIIATRWHSDDLIGRILQNFPGDWENIRFPALAEEDDIIGRKLGEPLFPERYSTEYLLKNREILGTVFFQALFQQRPVDEVTKISSGEWLKIAKTPPVTDLKWCRVWDFGATEGGGDPTTGTLCGYSKSTNIFIIANCYSDRISSGEADVQVRKHAELDGTDTMVLVLQEPGASGKAVVAHFQSVVLPEFKVEGVPEVKSKAVRAQPVLAAAEAGKVYLMEGPWNGAFIREFDLFPGGQNDDRIDTAAAGYNKLSGKKTFTASWGRKIPQDKSSTKALRRASLSLGTPRSTIVSRVTFGRRA